jgi:DNA repair exonuclease SbcCD nuclease subunit
MRLLLIGDVHLSDTPPSVRTDSYADDILAKLEWIVDTANRSKVDWIVQLGDLFHIKTPSRTSHALLQRTAQVLEQSRVWTWVVPGNHDMRHDRLDSLSSQPLGTLALSPDVWLLDGQAGEIYGIPYTEDLEKFQAELDKAKSRRIKLIAAHAAIFPPGVHPPYPHWNADQLDTHGTPLAYGHIHEPHGFYEVNGTWFCNNGAISRGSLHEETLNREPAVTIFDDSVGGNPFTSIPVPFKPAEQVFRLAEHQEERAKAARLDDFLRSVGGVSLTSLSLEQIIDHVRQGDLLGEDAQRELRDIVESLA